MLKGAIWDNQSNLRFADPTYGLIWRMNGVDGSFLDTVSDMGGYYQGVGKRILISFLFIWKGLRLVLIKICT
jgi:hypothetical protein